MVPIHYSNVLRSWVLTFYEDVRPCLNDQRLSEDRITPYLDRLSPDALAEFRPKVETLVEEMIDRLVEKGAAGAEIEFIDSFAYHLPATRR